MTMRHGAAIAAALLFSLAGAAPAAHAQRERAPEGITVTGTGEVRIKPDIAYLTLGVKTISKSTVAATSENAARTKQVIDAIKRAGIPDTDIQTADYSIEAQFQRDPRASETHPAPPRLVGYLVTNKVEVTVRALAKVGRVIDTAVASGANAASGISFDLADSKAARNEALQKAVADATTKARLVLQAGMPVFGVERPQVRLLSVTEEGSGSGNRWGAMYSSSESPVQAGEQTISVTVTARFAVQSE